MIFDPPFPFFQLLGQLSIFPAWTSKYKWVVPTVSQKLTHQCWIHERTLTLLHAFDEAFILRQSWGGVTDSLWNTQLVSDQWVSEKSHLTQWKAVGGEPVDEHGLKCVFSIKGILDVLNCFTNIKCLFHEKRKQKKVMRLNNRLTMGKLIVRGRMIKGMILNTVFMVRRLGLSIPDSAPNCREGNIKRTCPTSCHRLKTLHFLGDRPPGWGPWSQWRPGAEYRKDLPLSGQETKASLQSVGWAQASKPSSSVQWRKRWRLVPEKTDTRLHLL